MNRNELKELYNAALKNKISFDEFLVTMGYKNKGLYTFTDREKIETKLDKLPTKKWIVSSITKGTRVNEKMLDCMKYMARCLGANFAIIPIDYKISKEFDWYDKKIEGYLTHSRTTHLGNYRITNANKNPFLKNPIAGYLSFAPNESVLVASPIMAYTTRPTLDKKDIPNTISTTLTCCIPTAKDTKMANILMEKVELGCVYLEGNRVTHLFFDGVGITYNGIRYTENEQQDMQIGVYVMSDTHLHCHDKELTKKRLRFLRKNDVRNVAHHDIHDHNSNSHHDGILAKYYKQSYLVEEELQKVVDYLNNDYSKYNNLIIASNHNDHLDKWLHTTNPLDNIKDLKIYHQLNYLKLLDCNKNKSALQVFLEMKLNKDVSFEFIKRSQCKKIHGIDISQHGDLGVNGARGGNSLQVNGIKTLIGHSHSPKVLGSTWCVGVSNKTMEYAQGYSSWDIVDAVVYENGYIQYVYHD